MTIGITSGCALLTLATLLCGSYMVECLSLAASPRGRGSKSVLKKLRKSGSIPGVLYGGGSAEPEVVELDSMDIERAKLRYDFLGRTVPVDLDFGDGKIVRALLRDLQVHPCTDAIEHLDFQRVSDDQVVLARVPLVIEGADESKVVKMGGKPRVLSRSVSVICKFSELPDSIKVDVSSIGAGEWLRLSDLCLPPGVQYSRKRGFTADLNRQVAVIELKKKR